MSLLDSIQDLPANIQSSSRLPADVDDLVSKFMPARQGRPHCGPRQLCFVSVLILLWISFSAVVLWASLCFASPHEGGECFFYLPALEKVIRSTAANRQWWGLLASSLLVASLVLCLATLSAIIQRLLQWRRTTRLRHRVVSAMSGVTSRSDATRQLINGMRKVISLVHDPSLTVTLTFEGLSYKLRDGTAILTDASGAIAPDEITVVMGPSGCGKSTLLSLLSGKLEPNRGSLCLNGKPGTARDLHKLIAFVPQVRDAAAHRMVPPHCRARRHGQGRRRPRNPLGPPGDGRPSALGSPLLHPVRSHLAG